MGISKTVTILNEFLLRRGVSLAEAGSAEYGIQKIDAIDFFNLLKKLDVMPLVIEVWKIKGWMYRIEPLSGGHSTGNDKLENFNSALDYVLTASLNSDDLQTVRF